MLISFIIVVFLLLGCCIDSQYVRGGHQGGGLINSADTCNPYLHNPEIVEKSVVTAKEILVKNPSAVALENRLVVMVIFGGGFNDQVRLPHLRCSLRKLQLNIMPNTPLDIYLWVPVKDAESANIPDWLKSPEFNRVFVMPIPPESFRIPCGLSDDSTWTARKHFSIEYYIMGRWRMTFAIDFVRAMGYKYYLQLDDDAMVNNQVSLNIVENFKAKGYNMGVFSDHFGEPITITNGLPELTKYWLTINKFTPRGTLLERVRGNSLANVNSDDWDRYYHPVYFLILDMDYWFGEDVQSFVSLVMKTGRDIEGRWLEQMIQNMVRLVFIPKEKVWVMNEVDVGHDRHHKASFDNWCVKTGIIK